MKQLIITSIFILVIISSASVEGKEKWSLKSTMSFSLYYQDVSEEEIEELAKYSESEFDRISDAAGYIPHDKINIYIKKETGFGSAMILKSKEMRSMEFSIDLLQDKDKIDEIVTLMISQIIIGNMFQRSNVISGARLPQWFVYGAALYIANYKTRNKINFNHVYSSIHSLELKKLKGMEAMVTGEKVFNCIETYGESSVKNAFDLARILRDEEKAISNTVGMKYETFLESCSLDSE